MSVQRLITGVVGLCAAAAILVPSPALAANTTCANADFLFPGQMGAYSIAASGDLYFKAKVHANRSYAAIVWAPFQDVGEGGVALSVTFYSDNTCTASAPGANSTDYEPYVFTVTGHSADHDSVIAPANGEVYLHVGNGIAASGYTVHVLFIETTLFSPWWFTGGSNQAFILVRNNMNATTTANITLYASNGSICGTTTLAVAANGNGAVSVGSVGTCASAVSGSASIGFAGTPGGLSANITTIDAVQGTSFDAPFGPRMVWSMMAR